MKFISDYQQFDLISEATLDDSKINISYLFSRTGREIIDRLFRISQDIKLINTSKSPRNGDTILWIRPSSVQSIKFSDLKQILNITSKDDLMIYQTTSKKFPWAVAKRGIKTTMVKQAERVGSAKRGEHFRETAFLVTLAVEAWKMKGVKLNIMSNRGPIEMEYRRGVAGISNSERGEFRKEYDMFMIANKNAVSAMIDQCRKLIERLGDDVANISYVTKNTSDLLINQMATNFIKDEIQIAKESEEEGNDEILNLPPRVSIAKWNPSDIWIVFKGYEWTMQNPETYESEDIDTLSDLNEFLMASVVSNSGLVGISLKQASKQGIIVEVNTDIAGVDHTYTGFNASNHKKTVSIKFRYKFGTKNKKAQGESFIDCRTYDTSNRSNISLEVKGSKSAKHMSGKAGSIIERVMPKNLFQIKEFIRLETNKRKISEFLNEKGWEPQDDEIYSIFYEDLNTRGIKTGDQNSRMQSMVLLDWLLGLPSMERNILISRIVRFAKSESVWSAPHLVAK